MVSVITALPGIGAVYSFLSNLWYCLPNVVRFLIFANFGITCLLAFYKTTAK